MGHQRAAPQLAPCTITEPIVISASHQSATPQNMNEEQLDELFNEMDVDFENILDQESSDEELLSDDTECDSDLSECEMDVVEKFISVAEIGTLNPRTKVCISHDYFTTGGALALCTKCMFNIADIVDAGMYIYRKHETGSFGKLSGRSCTNCRSPLCKIVLKTWKTTSEWNANCWSSATRSLLWLEELCRTKRPRLAVGQRQSAVARIERLVGAKSQLERRFVHVGGEYAGSGYASGNERSLVWREIEAFESRIATGPV
ncbi:hypothetical protein ALC57_07657 [Trachymyrmex cornetzi]|uniref:Uncharacterized protein n=1 Tax=Trachymyrmex cornetzi TaxID=471704 RepID=A0A151J7K5_9HYME|nr:hypothetical protein ALC57_07657 [Trachymyrmex cornetzi]